ncbi:Cyclochlorotine biosynthesis protein O [Lasiodiplodia hormozganensis]|uniref:Cyclochlorotine biosynthesis protein O n=1 Tax=Lasiodiplodia hormozganensis TaxID=869390 RepID=A0AA39YKN2_9PEZI|nr:Cyclochlorotine biosynthesis protein O [Lasiodiplodia hormozganensis]
MFEDKSRTSSSSEPEDSERLLSDDDNALYERKTPRKTRSWIATTVLVTAVACIAGFTGAWIASSNWRHNPTEISCTKQLNQFSPLWGEVDISYEVIQFNGSLLKENIFRQDASPEVDAAWESLGVNYRGVAIPADKAGKAGIAKDQVKVSEKYGGGYPANVEGLHHLHCLNLLRQTLYYNYDYYRNEGKGAFLNADHIVRKHVSHCLDIIRQQLMCTVDTGVLGQVWYKPHDAPLEAYVDFNTHHKCRNFDAVRAWAEEHQMPATVPNDFLQPPAPGDTIYTSIP